MCVVNSYKEDPTLSNVPCLAGEVDLCISHYGGFH